MNEARMNENKIKNKKVQWIQVSYANKNTEFFKLTFEK